MKTCKTGINNMACRTFCHHFIWQSTYVDVLQDEVQTPVILYSIEVYIVNIVKKRNPSQKISYNHLTQYVSTEVTQTDYSTFPIVAIQWNKTISSSLSKSLKLKDIWNIWQLDYMNIIHITYNTWVRMGFNSKMPLCTDNVVCLVY